MREEEEDDLLINVDTLDDDLEKFQQDDIIREAISKGVDLRQYAQHIESELKNVEKESIGDYALETDTIVDVYTQIRSCDNTLARMQEMLLGFQADLGGISDEIRHLQDESHSMNIKLKNRRQVEEKLEIFLNKVVIPPSLIEQIDSSSVNDAYIEYLTALNAKLRYANGISEPHSQINPTETLSVQDTRPELDRLKNRAIAKIREFLLSKLNELKRPKTNVQMLQQNVLLKLKYLMTFLSDTAPEIETEIREMYVDTMSKTIHSVFKSYHASLMKLHREIASKNDLIVLEEQALKGIFTSKVDLRKRNETLALNERDQVLQQVAAPPIMVHVAQAEGKKYAYEVLFRSLQQHLMNTATSEYLFAIDFFSKHPRDLFVQIFAKTLSLCLENLENFLFTCHDAIGLLLMIRITHAQRYVMQKRRIPCLDSYFDRVIMLLWPRFKIVFEANFNSIRHAKLKKLGTVELHPHYIVRRYAEFAASILSLHVQHVEATNADEMLLTNLAAMRKAMVELLTRLSNQHKTMKSQIVFLINNYDQILQVFDQRQITSDETIKFEDLLAEQREKFVEEELQTTYGCLIQFVQETEHEMSMASENGQTPTVDVVQVEGIVQEFACNWKNGIETINSSMMTYFSNFKNGMEILKQVLTQLLLYYTRFIEIIKKTWDQPPPFSNEIITTHDILYEIKKYSRSY